MKKLSMFIAMCAMLLMNAYAQKNSFTGFHVGATGGFDYVWIMYQNTYGAKELRYAAKFGGTYNLETGYDFTDHVGVQLELGKSAQGQNYADVINDQSITRQVNLSYLQIPLLFKYSGGGTSGRFYAMMGPQWGILTSSSIYYNGNLVNASDLNNKASAFFEKTDFGIKFQMGYDIILSRHLYLNAGIQFYYGLDDINNPEFRNSYEGFPYHASLTGFGGLNTGLHYRF